MRLISYDQNIEENNRANIETMISLFVWFFPSWIEHLHISLDNNSNGSADASMGITYEYRSAKLSIKANWLVLDKLERQQTIIHEIAHLHVDPLYSQALRILKKLSLESNIMEMIEQELENTMESVVEDISNSIVRMYNPASNDLKNIEFSSLKSSSTVSSLLKDLDVVDQD